MESGLSKDTVYGGIRKRKREESNVSRKRAQANIRSSRDNQKNIKVSSSSSLSTNQNSTSNNVDEYMSDHADYMDLISAVRKGLKETSQLPLGDFTTHRYIGSLVKLYSSDDDKWYCGRALVYNPTTKLYFVYFERNGRTNWLDIAPNSDTAALLVEEYVNHNNLPAQKFIGTDKGVNMMCRNMTGVYTEYFSLSNGETPEYVIANESDLKTLADNWPQKANTKCAASCQLARETLMEIARIRQVVQEECKSCMMDVAKGYDWIGTKVRVESVHVSHSSGLSSEGKNALKKHDTQTDTSVVKYFGRIVDYCPSIDKHFVVFEEECISPKWVSMTSLPTADDTKKVEVILDWAFEAVEQLGSIAKAEKVDASCNGKPSSRSCTRKSRSCRQGKKSDEGNEVCGLCKRGVVMGVHDMITCSKCFSQSYHRHCMPDPDTQLSDNNEWSCWRCVCCQGCGASSWLSPVESISLREVLNVATAPADSVTFCRQCIDAYRTGSRGYCRICYRFYGLQLDQQVHPLSPLASSGSLVYKGNNNVEDDGRMMQCNGCQNWIHSSCEGIDDAQYESITNGTHPVWGVEYLCPKCRIEVILSAIESLESGDKTGRFKEPVNTEVTKLCDVPVNLHALRSKARIGKYMSLQALREDFELMCLNTASLIRCKGESVQEAVDFFDYSTMVFQGLSHATHMTTYGMEFSDNIKPLIMKELSKDMATSNICRNLPQSSKIQKQSGRQVDTDESCKNFPSAVVSTENIISTGEETGIVTRKRSGATATGISYAELSDSCSIDRQKREAIAANADVKESTVQELPKHVTCLPGPRNALVFEEQLLAPEMAMFECCREACAVCASSGSPQYFIFCSDCGECFHSFCVDAPFSLMQNQAHGAYELLSDSTDCFQSALERWKCLNCCAVCTVCEKHRPNQAAVFCSVCENMYHARCVSPSLVESIRSWVCSECSAAQCSPCRAFRAQDVKRLPLDRLVGAVYFKQHKKIWGVGDKCLRCICAANYLAHEEPLERLFQLNINCVVCNASCGEEISARRQCISCLRYVHTVCCDYDDGMDFDTDTICGEYICPTCAISELACSPNLNSSIKSAQLPDIYKQVALIRRNQLQAWHNGNRGTHNSSDSMTPFSRAHMAIVMWAAERYVGLSQSRDLPRFKDKTIPQFMDVTARDYRRHSVRARQFLRMCRPSVSRTLEQNKARLVSLLSGGLFTESNVMRPPSAFSALCRMAASFIAVTDIEWRSINKQGGKDIFIKSFHYRFPPDRAVDLVIQEFMGNAMPDNLSKPRAMQKIHTTWDSLLSSSDKVLSVESVPEPDSKLHQTTSLVYGIDASQYCRSFRGKMLICMCDTVSQYDTGSRRDWNTLQQLAKRSRTIKLGKVKRKGLPGVGDIDYSNGSTEIGESVSDIESGERQTLKACGWKSSLEDSTRRVLLNSNSDPIDRLLEQAIKIENKNSCVSVAVSRSKPCRTDADSKNKSVQHKSEPIDVGDFGDVAAAEMLCLLSSLKPSPLSPESGSHSSTITPAPIQQKKSKKETCSDKSTSIRGRKGTTTSEKNSSGAGVDSTMALKKQKRQLRSLSNSTVKYSGKSTSKPVAISPVNSVTKSAPKAPIEKYFPLADHLISSRMEQEESRFSYKGSRTYSVSSFQPSLFNAHDPTGMSFAPTGWVTSSCNHELTQRDPGSSAGLTWRPVVICLFCKDVNEDAIVGRLVPMPSGSHWAHVNCMRVSAGVCETNDGHLVGVEEAALRWSDVKCTYCNVSGASIICERRGCENRFHLKCSLVCECAFKEMKQTIEPNDHDESATKWNAKVVVSCFAHRKSDTMKSHYALDCLRNPLRCLHVRSDEESRATFLDMWNLKAQSLRTGASALRVGALTIHRLGLLSFDSPGHHTADYIYPKGFQSTRIYWSMTNPRCRTLYTFEIQSVEYDEVNPFQKLMFPVPKFVVAVADQPGKLMTTRSIEEMYQRIINAVWECNRTGPRLGFDTRLSKLETHPIRTMFGHTAQHFFGVGTDIVRYSMEILPEALAAIMPICFFSGCYPACDTIPQYKPRFHVPRKPQFKEVLRRRTQHRLQTGKSLQGSYRAEGYVRDKRRCEYSTYFSEGESIGTGKGGNIGIAEATAYDTDPIVDSKKKLRTTAKLEVRRSEIHGWGLFATDGFPKDSMVVEFLGEKIRQAVVNMREEQYEREGIGSRYMFRIDDVNVMDATRMGGMARFINHSCDPNTYVRVISARELDMDSTVSSTTGDSLPANSVDEFNTSLGLSDINRNHDKHIVVFSARTIHPGEEITYSYQFRVREAKCKCFCGTTVCKGTMN